MSRPLNERQLDALWALQGHSPAQASASFLGVSKAACDQLAARGLAEKSKGNCYAYFKITAAGLTYLSESI